MAKEEILTLEEISRYLKMSKDTIYRMVKRGDIPCFKVGQRHWRFKKERIDEWLTKQEKQRSRKVSTMKRKIKRKG